MWDDTRNIRRRMNNAKHNEDGVGNITTDIKSESVKSGCESIMPKWERECPDCHKIITYTRNASKLRADKINGRCRKCAVSETGLSNIGKIVSQLTRRRMGDAQLKRKNIHGFLGKHHNNETLRKMRIAATRRVIALVRASNGRINNIGKQEGKYFSNLELENGWDGIYYSKNNTQFFVENLGYFIDYYEPKLNIVVEYDEPYHYLHRTLRPKDVKRMNEIKSYLNCKFYRYNELGKELVEY